MFSLDHFKGNSGYRWNDERGRFSTPLDRQMKSNYRFDNNLQAENILSDLEVVEATRKEKEERTKAKETTKKKKSDVVTEAMLIVKGHEEEDTTAIKKEVAKEAPKDHNSVSSLTTTGRMVRDMQMADMVETMNNPDLDSLTDDSIERCEVKKINSSDDNSVASSLTDWSVSEASDVSPSFSEISMDTDMSDQSGISSVISGLKKKSSTSIIEIIAQSTTDPMSDEQLRKAVTSYHNRNYNKSQQKLTAALEIYLQNRNLQSNDAPVHAEEKSSNQEKSSVQSVASNDSQDTAKLHNYITEGDSKEQALPREPEQKDDSSNIHSQESDTTSTNNNNSNQDTPSGNEEGSVITEDSIDSQDTENIQEFISNNDTQAISSVNDLGAKENQSNTNISETNHPADSKIINGETQDESIEVASTKAKTDNLEIPNKDVAKHILDSAKSKDTQASIQSLGNEKETNNNATNDNKKPDNHQSVQEEQNNSMEEKFKKPKASNTAPCHHSIILNRRQSERLAQIDKQNRAQNTSQASSGNTGKAK